MMTCDSLPGTESVGSRHLSLRRSDQNFMLDEWI